jgi:hypothetical protein
MSGVRINFVANLLFGAALLMAAHASPLRAQAGPGSSADFPRSFLAWYFAGDAEQVWAHSAPAMREAVGDQRGLRQGLEEMNGNVGAETAMLSEQVFEHPEGGGMHVYVRGVRHANVPELFWIVIYSPEQRQVLTVMPQPRQTIRTLFPQVRLP